MKFFLLSFLAMTGSFTMAQSVEKIEIPKGVVYNYSDAATYEKAKLVITAELSDSPAYTINKGVMFIGPVLWLRYQKVKVLNDIKGGNVTIRGYKQENSTGKMTQSESDFKLVWDQLRSEVKGSTYKLRKATVEELRYYWAVISFDIEEPLIIIEQRNTITFLIFLPKT